MYNFKEKKIHFNALRNPDVATIDLELLQKISPPHPKLRTFSREPKRYSDDILYTLLDFVSREDIRGYRRHKQEEFLRQSPEETQSTEGEKASESEGVENNTPAIETVDSKDNSHELIEDLKQTLEKTEERAGEAQQRAEEAEERADEAEERAETAEEALEEEKKKEQPE